MMKYIILCVFLLAGLVFRASADDQLLQQALKNGAIAAGKLDVMRFNNHSTAVQSKLNKKVDNTKFSLYSTHRQSEITALQSRPTTTGTNTGDVTIGTANGLSLAGQVLSMQAATNSVPGAMTAADHTTLSTALQPGGALGTPSSGNLNNCTFPILNQPTTSTSGGLTGAPNITVGTTTTTGGVTALPGTPASQGASRMYFVGSSTGGYILADGPDTSTVGAISIYLRKSDASGFVNPVNISSTGIAVTGTISVSSGGSTNHAVCWKSAGVLGYCSAVVAVDGTCGTCN